MREAVLHIGMHKTGTTSIQSALERYDDGTVRYARLDDGNHSIPLYTLFSERRCEYYIYRDSGRSPAQVETLRFEAEKALDRELSLGRPTIVLSGEDMCFIEPAGVRAMRDFLLARVDRVRVIAYVRDPVGFASSALQQYVIGGSIVERVPQPRYADRFGKYLDAFGRENVQFVKFDRDGLFGRSVVPDFCHRVGIDPATVADANDNECYSREVVQLMFLFNRDGMPTQGDPALLKARRQLVQKLKEALDGPALKLSPAQVLPHVDPDDLAWMESVSGLALRERSVPGSEVASATELQSLLTDVEYATLRTLQEEVAKENEAIARSVLPTQLLDYLFLSRYFKVRRERAPDAVAMRALRRLRKRLVPAPVAKGSELPG